MPEKSNPPAEPTQPNAHLNDPDTGTKHGVPEGVAQEESIGLPDSGRHATESAPLHPQHPSK
jgi:hypothetical protein